MKARPVVGGRGGSWPELPFTLNHIAGKVRIYSSRHATGLRKIHLITIETNPGPAKPKEIYICPICQGHIRRGVASVWCHHGGWVHLACTNLRGTDEWNLDFVCHRCSWCCPETEAEETSSSDNGKAHDPTEALALAAVPPQIGVTSDEPSTAKQGRRKRNRDARRVRRRAKREQA